MNNHYLKLRETTLELNYQDRIAEAISNKRRAETVVPVKVHLDYSEEFTVRVLPYLRTRYFLRDYRLGYRGQTVQVGDQVEAKLPTFRRGGSLVYPGFYIADLLINGGEFPWQLREYYKSVTFLERPGSFLVVASGTVTAM